MHHRTSIFSVALIFALLALSATAFAAVPGYINYQGILTDGAGDPVVTTESVVFTIYDAATLGNVLWTETRNVTPDADGRFFVILGQAVPITDTIFRTPPCWLGTTVSTDPELTPRTLLSSVPYTYRVATLDGASGGDVIGEVTILTDGTGEGAGVRDPGGNVGNYTPTAAVFVDSVGDRTVSYGIDGITISVNNAVIKDALNDTIFHVDADDTTLTLGSRSTALGQGAVAIGDSCSTEGDYSTIAGGRYNRILIYNRGSFIGAGEHNLIQDDLVNSFIGAGWYNECLGDYATIGGGQNNIVYGDEGVVPGGFQNEAGERSFAAGNRAKANTIGSFVWADNTAADFTSSANHQFLVRASGGIGIGTASTIAQFNLSEPDVTGSKTNITQGLSRAGLNIVTQYVANAYTPGLFWSTENNNATLPKAGIYLRATSNGTRMYLGTSNNYGTGITNDGLVIDEEGSLGLNVLPNYPLHLANGAHCTSGGTWTNGSDVNSKENIEPVDGGELLAKIAALPVSKWNYRNEDPSITHIGPMAQDFHAIFGLGGDDKSISTIDPSGIALAAIQALHKRNLELEAQIAELRSLVQAKKQE